MARIEDFRKEYEDLGYQLRLIATFRVGILSIFPAFVGALVRFMWEVSQREYGILLRVSLPLVGFFGTFVVGLLERRLTRFYDLLIQRGTDLEEIVDIYDGVYHRIMRLRATPALRRLSMAVLITIGVVFFMVFIVQLVALMQGTL
ncbi:MAG: hypothetical protein HY001_01485 [Candidatus Portnoybacteria bacterium]|nr:hypothetical protein [Candidatus Portnoybacteria bacterium]